MTDLPDHPPRAMAPVDEARLAGLVGRVLASDAPEKTLEETVADQIAEFSDAEVLIYRNAVVVIDSAGNVAEDCCVGEYPEAIRAKVVATEQAGDPFPSREADEAVLISDRFPAPGRLPLPVTRPDRPDGAVSSHGRGPWASSPCDRAGPACRRSGRCYGGPA